jgi:2-polyprenyl-3-methyl-5-hydroxy-6-metoxy-1,4-benzoquinol methylase
MDRSTLVRLFGFRAMLIYGDTLVVDRWNWLKRKLPPVKNDLKVLDIGCGNGVFAIGLALAGYSVLGLTWSEEDRLKAVKRAALCGARRTKFELQNVRFLDGRKDLINKFDIVICLETIEHIINDKKLMADMARCLKKGGRLLLTTPNRNYAPFWMGENKKKHISSVEDGRHVRIGYTKKDLSKLCEGAGLAINELGYCGGFLSQKITGLMRFISGINPVIGWLVVLPLRPLPVLFDRWLTRKLKWEEYMLYLAARKKRP